MGEISEKFNQAFRDNPVMGVPASGAHEPVKSEIRAIALPIEAAIAAAAVAGVDPAAAEALIAPLLAAAEDARDEAALAVIAAEKAQGSMTPFAIGGDLPNGGLTNGASFVTTPPAGAIIPALQESDPLLVARGVKSKVVLAAGQTFTFRTGSLDEPAIRGDNIITSLIITRQAGQAYPAKSGSTEFIAMGTVPIGGAGQQAFIDSNPALLLKTENIDANTRRYVVGGQLENIAIGNRLDYAFVTVTNTSASTISVSALGIGASPQFSPDLDYRDYDPAARVAIEARIAALENPPAVGLVPFPIGGNLPAGAPSGQGSWFPGIPTPQIVETANSYLNSLGINYEAEVESADQGVYFLITLTPDQSFGNGDWVSASYLIRKAPADAWSMLSGAYVLLSTIQDDGGQPQGISSTDGITVVTQTDVSENIRRITLRRQYTALTDNIDKLILLTQPIAGKTVYYSGFGLILADAAPLDVDWSNWGTYASGASITLLASSSYDLIQGRPLKLLGDGMTLERGHSEWGITAIGQNGTRAGRECTPMLRLDGADFSGAGQIFAERRGTDETGGFRRRNVTFYSSAPAKTGSPRILFIGDSLTDYGMATATRDKLVAAGVSPVFVGTLASQGGSGVLAEGRPNWMATNYTTNAAKPNHPGYGMIYDVFSLRPDGGSGLVINVTRSGGAVTAATASGGTGYANGTWDVVFQNQGDNLAGSRRARGRIVVSGGVPGAITITDGGAGYTGTVTAQIAASVTEYKALGNVGQYGPRWHYNPFRNFSGVYSPTFYVTNFLSGTAPDQVVICLGMNDLWGGGGTPETAAAAIIEQADAWNAAYPNTHVAIAVPGQATESVWTDLVTMARLLLAEYAGRESSKLYVRLLFQVTDAKAVFSTSTDAVDSIGVETVSISDPTHPSALGRSQQAEMLFAWSMCRL